MKLKKEKIIGFELLFDQNHKLIAQEMPKSLLSAFYLKSILSFRKEINFLMKKLLEGKTEDLSSNKNSYFTLNENQAKKTYSKQTVEILFLYFGDIYFDEIELNYSKIKSKYHASIRKPLRKHRTSKSIQSQ